jgi:hypothetical protein
MDDSIEQPKSSTPASASPQDTIASLYTITDEKIPKLVKCIDRTHKALSEVDALWFDPLFSTANGWKVLMKIKDDVLKTLFPKRYHVMLVCLFIQKSFGSLKNVILAATVMNKLIFTGIIPNDRIVNAIKFYLDPANVNQIDEKLFPMLPKSTQTSIVPEALHQSINVPPHHLPALFPQFNTSQFAPQYAWFMYLLSLYSPPDL